MLMFLISWLATRPSLAIFPVLAKRSVCSENVAAILCSKLVGLSEDQSCGNIPYSSYNTFPLKAEKKDDDRKSCSKTEHRDLAIIVSGFFVTEDGHKFEHCLHTSEWSKKQAATGPENSSFATGKPESEDHTWTQFILHPPVANWTAYRLERASSGSAQPHAGTYPLIQFWDRSSAFSGSGSYTGFASPPVKTHRQLSILLWCLLPLPNRAFPFSSGGSNVPSISTVFFSSAWASRPRIHEKRSSQGRFHPVYWH